MFGENTRQLIKQQWMRKRMNEKKHLFTESLQIKIFCGTWNVNGKGKVDDSERISSWLIPNKESISDIYAIGLQEIVPLNPVNVAVDPLSSQRTAFWELTISNCLNNGNSKYELLRSKNLVGILLCIYVRADIIPYIRDLRCGVVGVGALGVMGNKGGVAIRFCLHKTNICFVCAHLTAKREDVEGRNRDYHMIIDRMSLLAEKLSINRHQEENIFRPLFLQEDLEENFGINNHDVIFWLGDLNYRIDTSLNRDDILQLINDGDLLALRSRDQLINEKRKDLVFVGFEEGDLTFKPTYKYQQGTDIYESRLDKKLRPPAWCDRVLWRSNDSGIEVKLLNYNRAELLTSDHKPVYSYFNCQVRAVLPQKEQEIYQALLRQLDYMENAEHPKVEIGPSVEISIRHVPYRGRRYASLVIGNVGNSVVNWLFVAKSNEAGISKPWLHVEPNLGMLPPSEKTEVLISVYIEPQIFNDEMLMENLIAIERNAFCTSLQFDFNEMMDNDDDYDDDDDDVGSKVVNLVQLSSKAPFDTNNQDVPVLCLNDILVLRIENGRDYFISVEAEFEPDARDVDDIKMNIEKSKCNELTEQKLLVGSTKPSSSLFSQSSKTILITATVVSTVS